MGECFCESSEKFAVTEELRSPVMMRHSSKGALLWLAGGEVSGAFMRCWVLEAGYQTDWTSSQELVWAIA